MFANFTSQDRTMLIVVAVCVVLELFSVVFFSLTGNSAKMRSFLSRGGVATATFFKREAQGGKYLAEYHFQHNGRPYALKTVLKDTPEKIAVFFDPNDPNVCLTNAGESHLQRRLPQLIPALITVVMVIAYKLIYG